MVDTMPSYIGRSVVRREDNRFLKGAGKFVGDMKLEGMVHVAIVRSQQAHARINSVDLEAARNADGVVLALAGAELKDVLPPISGMQVAAPKGWRDGMDPHIEIPDQTLVPYDKLRYVGEPYALVVAGDRYMAEDAAELIEGDFEPLPPVANAEVALDAEALVHDHLPGNIAATLHAKKGDGEAALATAPHRLKRRYFHHRYAAMPMECRGVVAEYDSRTDSITVWSSTQVVHWVRREGYARRSRAGRCSRCWWRFRWQRPCLSRGYLDRLSGEAAGPSR